MTTPYERSLRFVLDDEMSPASRSVAKRFTPIANVCDALLSAFEDAVEEGIAAGYRDLLAERNCLERERDEALCDKDAMAAALAKRVGELADARAENETLRREVNRLRGAVAVGGGVG